jgi:hypothetical protein
MSEDAAPLPTAALWDCDEALKRCPLPQLPGSELYRWQWRDPIAAEAYLQCCAVSGTSLSLRPDLRAAEELFNDLVCPSVVVDSVAVPDDTTFNGQPIPLPLEQAAALYAAAEPSMLGVEGVGTVLDTRLRKSHEVYLGSGATAGSFALPPQLATFDFPEARRRLHEDLCPRAREIEVRPYKVVVYKQGDFFATHVDSMSEAAMFGSLALQIPIASDAPLPEPDDATVVADSEQGNLVFYVGREISPSFDRDTTAMLRNKADRYGGSFGRNTAQDPLRISVDLTTPLPRRLDSVGLKYAAWHGDVPHEVARVTQPFRVVLLYRLFKRGDVPRALMARPLVDDVRRHFASIFGDMRSETPRGHLPLPISFVAPVADDEGNYADVQTDLEVSCVGIILRHTYPPAGLRADALKGVDAAAHQALSGEYECHLLPAVDCHADFQTQPFRFDSVSEYGSVFRRVLSAADTEVSFEVRFPKACTVVPMIAAVWFQLGYGEVYGGGHSYGNWDCMADWWYRTSVMVVLPRPGKWHRRRWFIFAALCTRAPTWARLFAIADLLEEIVAFA